MSADRSEARERARQAFTDDDIRRNDLPRDAFVLIHDLAYDHEGRDRDQYRMRARAILKVGTVKPVRKSGPHEFDCEDDDCGGCSRG